MTHTIDGPLTLAAGLPNMTIYWKFEEESNAFEDCNDSDNHGDGRCYRDRADRRG